LALEANRNIAAATSELVLAYGNQTTTRLYVERPKESDAGTNGRRLVPAVSGRRRMYGRAWASERWQASGASDGGERRERRSDELMIFLLLIGDGFPQGRSDSAMD
jgi:hypothetical protein